MEEMTNTMNILAGKSEGKSSVGRPRHRWEDIRMHLTEIGWEGVFWIRLAQGMDQRRALVNEVMNLRVP
jgi:hypothetical protein